ncbi:DUF5954 family protein [Streptomyces sp. NPDC086787]|uniref:DUF5954 family protein n=1 Tax=Streptomyces sp. NPDC086787 TaxID=3365759 RepID=UPI003805EDF8
MGHGDTSPDWLPPIVVRLPQDPVEAVVEADAIDAELDPRKMMVRGPLFGVVAQAAGEAPRWRVVVPVVSGCAQEARDSLNTRLWFRARDTTDDREERRALLAAVARLETEPVNELTVLGTRYRVVRAEEYAGMGRDGIEQPRPTDPEPIVPNWERTGKEPKVDDGLVLDPEAPLTPARAAERLAMRGLAYTGARRFPEDVRRDSRRALRTHPDVLLMPATFRIVEKSDSGWTAGSALLASAHDARRALDFGLTWMEPRQLGLIPVAAGNIRVDARSLVAEGTHPATAELAEFVRAADRVRAERCNQIEVAGTVRRICRARRLLRWGHDGPEGPRPSDTDTHGPERLHPFMDEDGTIHPDE